jgi:type IV secretory pathway VirB9-like protein
MFKSAIAVCVVSFVLCARPTEAQTTREISYNPRSVVRINAKLRFTTMIILPEQEQILDFVCGDKEFWIVSGAQNLAYVKPAKAGATTNLNLVTASGNVYSFLLTEGTTEADLKLYVVPDGSLVGVGQGARKFYAAADVDELRQAVDAAKKDAQAARDGAATVVEQQVNAFKASYPTRLDFPYRFKAHEKPFFVRAIYTDGVFTYLKADAPELPALYEVRDGLPNLVNFQVEHGVYVVPKVLESGYLAVGKQRLTFERGER